MKTQSPTEKRPLWCGPGGHGHGQDDRHQLGHGQVPGCAVDEAQQAVAAVGLGHVREQEVSGRERVDRERVERALFGAVVRLYMAVVDLGEAVQHRAGTRVVADLQHVESTRVVGCLRLLPPAEAEGVQGLSAAQLDWRRPAVRQHEALVSDGARPRRAPRWRPPR